MTPEQYQELVQARIVAIGVALQTHRIPGDFESVAALMATLGSLAVELGVEKQHMHDLVECVWNDYGNPTPPRTMDEAVPFVRDLVHKPGGDA